MIGGEPNLNVLRFNKVGDKNGQRVTFKGVYLLEDVKRWANAARDLIAKCQRELLTEVFQEFSGVLKIHVTAKIEYVDERWSSKAAKRSMVEQGFKTGHNKSVVDQTAAALFLQQYLDQK